MSAKRKKSPKRGSARSPRMRWVLRALAALFFVGSASLLTAIGLFAYYGRDLPKVDSLHYDPPQISRVLDRKGRLIAELFTERRTVVPMDTIPRVLVLAVLAAEDADFYEHRGLDYAGIVRALLRDAMTGKAMQGASTITQQLVKNTLLTPERTVARKVKELILARRLEQDLTKDQILHRYLNHINFGHGRYGVQEASRFYFGKDVEAINLAEASLLAGLPQAPTRLSPLRHPDAARARQRYVLDQLEKKRAQYWSDLAPEEIQRARTTKLSFVGEQATTVAAPEAARIAKQWLDTVVGAEKAQHGGYRIQTTIDLDLQEKARAALQRGVQTIVDRHQGKRQKKQDDARPQGAVVVLDPRTREVLALVGGEQAVYGFDRAQQAVRQPGSAWKPITYALALESGTYTPASLVLDAPEVFDNWKPNNYETWNYQGAIRLRDAVAQSINLVAVRVMSDLTPARVVEFARKLGITTDLDPSLALALGASDVRPIELVNAYATFAAGGRYAPYTIVRSIKDAKGKKLRLPESEPPRTVLKAATAYVLTSMLRSVVTDGTGKAAAKLGRPAAGKTGTSNDSKDAWFVGYTPELVGGVWIGFDDHHSLGRGESGSKAAVPIWVEVMQAALSGRPIVEFPVPAGVERVLIDPKSGLRAYDGMPDALEEVFVTGTAPVEVALPPDVVGSEAFMMEQLGGLTATGQSNLDNPPTAASSPAIKSESTSSKENAIR